MPSLIPALRIYRSQAALEALAAGDGLCSPFATHGWIRASLTEEQVDALIVFELDAAGERLVLPLQLRKFGGVLLAVSPGGALANYHAPILSSAFPAVMNPDLAVCLKDGLRGVGADCLLITDSPFDIGGAPNPLAGLVIQPSPDIAHGLTLTADFEGLQARLFDKDSRKKQRQKAKKRAELGDPGARFLDSGAEQDACLAQILNWKAGRFAKLGITDPFAGHEARATLTRGLANGSLRFFGLFAGTRLLAGLIGAMHQGIFSGVLNAHDPAPEIEKSSPGEALLLALVETLCLEGATRFDLGTGEARYKAGICPEAIPLFDMTLAATPKGELVAYVFLAMRALKGKFKRSSRAMAALAFARRFKAKLL